MAILKHFVVTNCYKSHEPHQFYEIRVMYFLCALFLFCSSPASSSTKIYQITEKSLESENCSMVHFMDLDCEMIRIFLLFFSGKITIEMNSHSETKRNEKDNLAVVKMGNWMNQKFKITSSKRSYYCHNQKEEEQKHKKKVWMVHGWNTKGTHKETTTKKREKKREGKRERMAFL